LAYKKTPTPSETSDLDGDGLSDALENTIGTNPNDSDTDFDGLDDGEEVNEYMTNPSNSDTDGDGLSDWLEVHSGSNPLVSWRD